MKGFDLEAAMNGAKVIDVQTKLIES